MLLPVPSSLMFEPFGPFRFWLTTYAYVPETTICEPFRSAFEYGLCPTTRGAAGFEMSTTVTVPA